MTPDKKKKLSSPPGPAKKRSKKSLAPKEDALLLITSSEDGPKIVTYSSNHPLLSGVGGHFCSDELELFYTDEIHNSVVRMVGLDLDEFLIDRAQAPVGDDAARELKRASVLMLFADEDLGGGISRSGEVYRGSFVV